MTAIRVQLQEGSVPQAVNRLRLVIGALLVGVLIFAAAAVLAVEKGSLETSPKLETPLLIALGVMVVGAFAAWSALRRVLIGKLRQAGEGKADHLLETFTTLTILGAALTEGVALFATVTYLLTASPSALVALAAAAFALVRQAPSEEGVHRLAREAGLEASGT